MKDTAKRAETFKQMANKLGVTVKEVLWTLGQYDVVVIAEAPDDMTTTALALSAGVLGNVRTQTLRALTEAEIKTVIAKIV